VAAKGDYQVTEQIERQMPSPEDWKELQRKMTKANGGDAEAIAWLRDFLDRNPQVWHHIGDLAGAAETAWIALISDGDVLAAEAIRRQLATTRENLIGQNPSAVEKLLGDQVMATLLEVKYLESISANAGGGSLTQAGLLLKRLESAQRRHAAAIKSLLQFRKLLPDQGNIPGLRIFQAERQSA
jgi:hypothetical protein